MGLHTEARIRSTPSASPCPWPQGGRPPPLYHTAFRRAEGSRGHTLCTDSLPKKKNREKGWATLTQFFQNRPLVHTSPKEERMRGRDIHSLQLGIKNIGEKFLFPQNQGPWGMWQTRYLTTSLQWIQYKKKFKYIYTAFSKTDVYTVCLTGTCDGDTENPVHWKLLWQRPHQQKKQSIKISKSKASSGAPLINTILFKSLFFLVITGINYSP